MLFSIGVPGVGIRVRAGRVVVSNTETDARKTDVQDKLQRFPQDE